MTYTLPEINDSLSLERQVEEYHHLLGELLRHHPKIDPKRPPADSIDFAGRVLKLFTSISTGQLRHACGVAHSIKSRGGKHKDGSPVVRSDLEKSRSWLRAAIEDILELVPDGIREEARSSPTAALASTQPLQVIEGISDPDEKARAILERAYAVLWKVDTGSERYPTPDAGLRPTLRQRLERRAREVPGLSQAALLEALAALEERTGSGTLGKSSANTVAKLLDPFRQLLIHFDAAPRSGASDGGGQAPQESAPAPSRSFERVALIAAGVVILFLLIDRFFGKEGQAASTGEIVANKIDRAARADDARVDLENTAAQVATQSFLKAAEDAVELVDELSKELKLRTTTLLALEHNDDGRRFAIDDANVKAFAGYLEKSEDWPGEGYLEAARERIEALRSSVTSALGTGVAPTPEMNFHLKREREDLQATVALYAKPRKQFERLVQLASHHSAQGPTLRERISQLEDEEARQGRDDLAEFRDQLEADRQIQLRDAEKEAFDAETAVLVGQKKDEAKLLRAKALKGRYPMFFTEGLYAFQGYHGSNGDDKKFDFARLPSLSDMEKLGLLNDERMFRAALLGEHLNYGTQFEQNDRSGFWKPPTSEEEEQAIKDAFVEFNELKTYFVQAEMLRQ